MADHEESEIFTDMGRILQAAAGASIQNAEHRARINQAKEDHANRSGQQKHAADQNVARNIKQDFHDRDFWRTATAESVGDRLSVARSLAADHPEAASAYMRAVDTLRKDYDLDISQLGRDHTNLEQYREVVTTELATAFSTADQNAAQAQAQAEEQKTHQAQAQRAAALEQEVYKESFWDNAGAESIADRVTVAQRLSADHPAAQTAYLHASDMLRNNYGINVEDMNRDHPTSPEDRHAALREALDDYFARTGLEVEQQQAASAGQDAAEAGNEPEATIEHDRAEDLGAQADRAGASDSALLAEADRTGAEAHQDQEHARAEEAAGGRQPQPYSRTSEAELAKVAAVDPAAARARRESAAAIGQSTHQRTNRTYQHGRPGSMPGKGQGKVQDVEVTR